MKSASQKVLNAALHLTPIGYVFRMLSLHSGEATSSGVFIELNSKKPVRVVIKDSPTIRNRLRWLAEGAFLIAQAYVVMSNSFGGDLGSAYAYTALIFGTVNVLTAVVPKFGWNTKLGNLFLFVLILVCLFVAVGYSRVREYYFP